MSIIKIIFIISLSLSFSLSSSSSSSSSPPPSSSNFNLTQILTNDPSHSFDIASSEFHSLKIDSEINPDSPVTIFVPEDSAFADAAGYIVLPVENKYFTWQCHMLSGYFSTSVLRQTAKDWPSQSTVATEIMGKNKFMLNLTATVNGSVAVSNTQIRAIVTRTVFDRDPIAIYGISKVLLPKGLPQIAPPPPMDVSAATAVDFFTVLVFFSWIMLCI